MERVGIYCRVSSASSAQIHSLSSQASYLLKYVLKRSGWIVEDIYIDIGSGTSVNSRPEFMRMLSDIELGKLTMVITKSVSRFGRNTEDILVAFRQIVSKGASIFFEEQSLSSQDADCELYVSLYGGIAQEENRQLRENIKWGIEKRAKDGSSSIYNRPCYGYQLNKSGEFEIKPVEASVVRDIFSSYINGLSIVKIISHLEQKGILSPTGKPTWSKRTIETILTNKKYIGTSVIYKTVHLDYPHSRRVKNKGFHDIYEYSNHHIPIIPNEMFEKAQEIRKSRTNIEIDADGNVHRKSTKYSAKTI